MFFDILTKNASETKKLSRLFAKEILKRRRQAGAIILALAGPLGSGKTTFIQGFCSGLGIKAKVLSPTFLILKPYPFAKRQRWLWHVDCYRLKNSRELLKLGFRDLLKTPENIIVIEWADRVKKLIPRESIWFTFTPGPLSDWRLISLKYSKK